MMQVYAWGLMKLGVLGCNESPGLVSHDPETGDSFQPRPTLVAGLVGRHVVQVAFIALAPILGKSTWF